MQPARYPGAPDVAVGVPTVTVPDGTSATSLFFASIVPDARQVSCLAQLMVMLCRSDALQIGQACTRLQPICMSCCVFVCACATGAFATALFFASSLMLWSAAWPVRLQPVCMSCCVSECGRANGTSAASLFFVSSVLQHRAACR